MTIKREASARSRFTRRALVLGGGQVGLLALLAGRLYQLQVVEAEKYVTLAEENRISLRLIAPPRGRLLDRHGAVIAGNRENFRAMLVAEQTPDVQATLATFTELVPLTEAERARIERDTRRQRRFVPVNVREFLSWDDMARLEVNAPDLPGILIDRGATRLYPAGEDFAHVLGYVAPPAEADVAADDDPLLALPGVRIGRAGMEKVHDTSLRGRAGAIQLEVNAVGRVIRELSRQEGTPGQDVTLTIDAELQRAAMARIGTESAAAVVLDARNGEVLAMASSPSFDPGVFNSGVSQAQWRAWMNNRKKPLTNKAISGLYGPGSTFKMVVALAGLEANAITPGERVHCSGYVELGDSRFHCWSRGGHGGVDMRAAIKHSCDIYFYEVARRLGIDRVAAMANRFCLGVETGIELPGARAGLMPTRAWKLGATGVAWQQGETLIHGIGQGFIQSTPLQLATMTARLATGRAVKPHLTRAIGGVVARGDRPEHWPVIGVSERNLRLVREAMNAVVNEQGGTAYASRLPDRQLMAGKTGTTQVRRITMADRARGIVSNANRPWEHRDHALFVAYAPYEAPAYAIAVIIEHGGGGSAAAAPVARDIMAETLARDPARRAPPAPPAPAAPPTRTAETRQDRG
jgi:penicillin-binding protein 2